MWGGEGGSTVFQPFGGGGSRFGDLVPLVIMQRPATMIPTGISKVMNSPGLMKTRPRLNIKK